MRSPSKTVVGLGAGLAAAGVGAALGLAAERWTAGRRRPGEGAEPYGSLRGAAHTVTADDGTELYAEVDDLDVGENGADADGGGAAGEGASPLTVVFSHGFCLNQDIWHFQRQWLRGRYRMVFWDQRGHGRSGTGPADHYTVDQCGRDLLAVVEALAPDGPLVLVGHSMGGMTVMALAGEQPDLVRRRVAGVALVATSSGGLADVHWGLAPSVGRVAHKVAPLALVGLTRAPRLVDRTRRLGSDLEQLLVKRYSYASPVPPELVRFTSTMIAATPISVVSGFLPGFDVHDKAAALAALDGLEALVLGGDEDLMTPAEHSDVIVRLLPGAEHVVVPEAGHLVMLEHPDVVNLHLGDLLDRADRAASEAAAD
jgi:pimeloyl-ACP methyl ester carboxylesterase